MQTEDNVNTIPFEPEPRTTTVLVVDDEDGVRHLLTHWIVSLGHTVKAAADAGTAMEMMRESQVDVAVCDILMPGNDGVWLIDQMRSEFPKTAIVIATGLGDMKPSVTLRAGVAGYLVKPFQRDDLATVITHAVAPDSPWVRDLKRIKHAKPLPEL
jgi:CheY-like chemotaxis protein